MGFFDKFIPKEITKPFTKVARKVIPKELRPALPFLAAATPFLLPGSFAIGGLNPALSRGIMSSLANIGTQQVMDPEGDINLVSAALAGLTTIIPFGEYNSEKKETLPQAIKLTYRSLTNV